MSREQRKRKVVSYTENSDDEGPIFEPVPLPAAAAKKDPNDDLPVVAPVIPPISVAECQAYIGKSMAKEFPPHGAFKGTFIGYDGDVCLWKVQYEDGDEEEIDWNELNALKEGGEPAAKKAAVMEAPAGEGVVAPAPPAPAVPAPAPPAAAPAPDGVSMI